MHLSQLSLMNFYLLFFRIENGTILFRMVGLVGQTNFKLTKLSSLDHNMEL